ncbi:MAG: MFS transporter, partial [Clostridia bacterium]|nr:MFS transporter [Clostridia bacterium]
FAVCLPMIVGPFIGSAVIRKSGAVYEDLGVVKSVPTPGIFLAAAVCVLLLVLPVVRLYRRKRT